MLHEQRWLASRKQFSKHTRQESSGRNQWWGEHCWSRVEKRIRKYPLPKLCGFLQNTDCRFYFETFVFCSLCTFVTWTTLNLKLKLRKVLTTYPEPSQLFSCVNITLPTALGDSSMSLWPSTFSPSLPQSHAQNLQHSLTKHVRAVLHSIIRGRNSLEVILCSSLGHSWPFQFYLI